MLLLFYTQALTDTRGSMQMVSRQSSASSSVPERGALRRTEDSELGLNSNGGGGSWDIFEPRAAESAAAAAAGPLSEGLNGGTMGLAALKQMTGGLQLYAHCSTEQVVSSGRCADA